MVFELDSAILVLLFILFIGLIVPELFKKLRIPYITILILFGAFLGPNGLNYVQPNSIIDFFGFLGVAFLLLMAGLEVKLGHLQNLQSRIYILAAANGFIPCLVGVAIVKLFGYSWIPAIVIGIVFFSSSFAIIVPILKSAGLFKKNTGQMIISAVMLEDIFSLFLLAIILQSFEPITRFPLLVYFGILIMSVIILKMFLPEFAAYFLRKYRHRKDEHETQLRFIIVLLIGVLLYFSALGVHHITAAFIVGILLADVLTSSELFNKLHTIAYGLFVPVFFFLVGMKTDFGVFVHFSIKDFLLISLVAGLIGSKLLSGYFAGRLVRFSRKYSLVFGIASTAQLTTTLAVTYAASSMGLIDSVLTTIIIIISVITTILAPLVLNYVLGKKYYGT